MHQIYWMSFCTTEPKDGSNVSHNHWNSRGVEPANYHSQIPAWATLQCLSGRILISSCGDAI